MNFIKISKFASEKDPVEEGEDSGDWEEMSAMLNDKRLVSLIYKEISQKFNETSPGLPVAKTLCFGVGAWVPT